MMFKTHPANIPQIKATIAAFGGCYFHGDGNLYALDAQGQSEESDFRKDFSNDTNNESRYRVKFNRGDKVPNSVEELDKMLLDSKNQELISLRNIRPKEAVKTVTVTEDYLDDVDSDIDYSRFNRKNK